MSTNKEIKIAIIVAILMVFICFLIFMYQKNSTNPETIDIKIYKSHAVEGKEDEHVYRECSLSTEDAIKINKEFIKAYNLKDSSKSSTTEINGTYKVISGERFVAFDNTEDNVIFIGDKNRIYDFKTAMYELVINACEG